MAHLKRLDKASLAWSGSGMRGLRSVSLIDRGSRSTSGHEAFSTTKRLPGAAGTLCGNDTADPLYPHPPGIHICSQIRAISRSQLQLS